MGSTMHATQAQLKDAKVDLAYRDFCAHLLIPLNECRKANYFLPWRCEHDRHVYEKCQYKECVARARATKAFDSPIPPPRPPRPRGAPKIPGPQIDRSSIAPPVPPRRRLRRRRAKASERSL